MNFWESEILNIIYSKNVPKAIKFLKQGFPINYSVRLRGENGSSQSGFSNLLIESINNGLFDLCEYLCKSGINVNNPDSKGRYPVHIASSLGFLDILILLENWNANLGARDGLGNTILHLSATNRHIHIVEYTVEKLKFPVIVLNKLMRKPVDLCKILQESSKSLVEIEDLEKIIQYLWQKEEEHKKHYIIKNTLTPRNNTIAYSKVKRNSLEYNIKPIQILPYSKKLTRISPFKGRQTIESYLKEKHEAIHRDNEEKQILVTLSNYSMRSPSPVLRLPELKPLKGSPLSI
jgi:Ankyrin repeats (3 copies)